MPNDYDRVIKENFDPLLPHLCRALLGLDLSRMEPLEAKIQVTTERELDNLKKVVHDDPDDDYGLHWEIQSDDEDMRRRNFLYYALFHHATGLPLKQIVLYVGDQKPKKILQNLLELMGLRLEFIVINIREVPKERFLNSEVAEEVVLALLCDFGQDRPQEVVRMILQNLLRIVGRVERLKKYQRQLQVLSRLRKLQPIVTKEISLMPIQFDIQTDELYLEGIEKGIEKGIEQGIEKGLEKGIEQQRHDTVVRGLRAGALSLEMIANLAGVSLDYVRKVQKELENRT
jgi:predicted transposase YdaD